MPIESVPVDAEIAPAAPAKKSGPAKTAFTKPNAVDAEKGYVRPHRDAVQHVRKDGGGKTTRCPVTVMRRDVAEFHARQPGVIDACECSACRGTFPAKEFVWNGTDEVVGT